MKNVYTFIHCNQPQNLEDEHRSRKWTTRGRLKWKKLDIAMKPRERMTWELAQFTAVKQLESE